MRKAKKSRGTTYHLAPSSGGNSSHGCSLDDGENLHVSGEVLEEVEKREARVEERAKVKVWRTLCTNGEKPERAQQQTKTRQNAAKSDSVISRCGF